jgi:molybdopterin-guanine dinucleotide biosynthesis protein B
MNNSDPQTAQRSTKADSQQAPSPTKRSQHCGRESPRVLSVVAKANTGKTTLLEQLIPVLDGRGWSIGVLKHHSHTSSFDTPGKDTYRIAEAGAAMVVGASPVQIATFRRREADDNLEAIINTLFAGMDLVLTEGYKRGPYPKLEVHRAARSTEVLCSAEELLAVVTDVDLPIGVPQFSLDDIEGLATFVEDWLAHDF